MPSRAVPRPTINAVHLPVRVARYSQDAEKTINLKHPSKQLAASCQLEYLKKEFKKLLHFKKAGELAQQKQPCKVYHRAITVFEATLKVNKRDIVEYLSTLNIAEMKRHFAYLSLEMMRLALPRPPAATTRTSMTTTTMAAMTMVTHYLSLLSGANSLTCLT
ncbi:hypothetical protein CBOM_05623 [Ceraceosorus bombacis]|uniref:Uncharacterized protein n=1 Tax=Ceraceosorus bombacis TaxID=401625 RepID=A0A0P1BSI0_9BASI|nr:hypothetical protein CBOM_05623 [Ceraceosorus bombacis]